MKSRCARALFAGFVAVLGISLVTAVFGFAYMPVAYEDHVAATPEEAARVASEAMGPPWPGASLDVSRQADGSLVIDERWVLWEARMEAVPVPRGWELYLGAVEPGPGRTLQWALALAPPIAFGAFLFRATRLPPDMRTRRLSPSGRDVATSA